MTQTDLAGDAAEIARLATAATPPTPVGTDPRAFVLPDGYSLQVLDPERYQPAPNRKRGTVAFTDAASFAEYVKDHRGNGTNLWADAKFGKLTAILDDHVPNAETAGWAQHRAVLTLEVTEDWTLWSAHNGKPMSQAQFAEFVEDAAPCIRQPSAAYMLEIAQSFKANTRVRFESGRRIQSGETQLTYVEDTAATAGRKGQLEVPEVITLGIAPWTSCTQAYELTARLRYRINDGALVLFYKLIRPDDVLREAFADVLRGVEEPLGIAAFHGSPRA